MFILYRTRYDSILSLSLSVCESLFFCLSLFFCIPRSSLSLSNVFFFFHSTLCLYTLPSSLFSHPFIFLSCSLFSFSLSLFPSSQRGSQGGAHLLLSRPINKEGGAALPACWFRAKWKSWFGAIYQGKIIGTARSTLPRLANTP